MRECWLADGSVEPPFTGAGGGAVAGLVVGAVAETAAEPAPSRGEVLPFVVTQRRDQRGTDFGGGRGRGPQPGDGPRADLALYPPVGPTVHRDQAPGRPSGHFRTPQRLGKSRDRLQFPHHDPPDPPV